MKNKLIYLLFTITMFSLFSVNVKAVDISEKIYDYAGILTVEEEKNLKLLIDDYIESYDMDMVIVTSTYYTESTNREYIEDFYDYNGFGLNDTHDGVIFIMDLSQGYKDVNMVTTGEAILVYDDNRIENIYDAVALEKDNGYYEMFEAFISSSASYADAGAAPSNKDYYIDSNGDLMRVKKFPIALALILPTVIATVVVIVICAKNKMIKKASNATEYVDKNSIKFTRREDRFITTHTTRVKIINHDSGSGGSGSSIHVGSSGISHGGGGGRRL